MSRTTLRNGVFAALMAAALGFGTRQAVAAPQGAHAARACSSTQDAYCQNYCWSRGADGGYCLSGGGCKCVYN